MSLPEESDQYWVRIQPYKMIQCDYVRRHTSNASAQDHVKGVGDSKGQHKSMHPNEVNLHKIVLVDQTRLYKVPHRRIRTTRILQ